jgi:glycerophosphoryl diester phosphodiesterase
MRRIWSLALVWAAACLTSMSVWAFDLQAHRGCRGLLPENTLVAFEHALRLGVTTLELDIAITADGVPVISHDPALNPSITRDAKGHWLTDRGPLIRSMSLAQVQTYDVGRLNPSSRYAREFPDQQPRDGQRIPTLASLFQLVKDLGPTRCASTSKPRSTRTPPKARCRRRSSCACCWASSARPAWSTA